VSFGTDGGFPFARGDRGRIDLLPFLHALLESPPGQPLARPADPNLSGALARTRVKGEVQLGTARSHAADNESSSPAARRARTAARSTRHRSPSGW
jgi:hypothetical protein